MRVSLLRRIADLVSPRQCCVCGRRLDVSESFICVTCYLQLPRTDHLDHPLDNELAKVFWGRVRHFGKAAAFMHFHHGSQSARPVYAFKYGKQPGIAAELGAVFARDMLRTGFLDDIDALVPVPLAKERQRQRGYNQSEEMARGMASVCHKPVLTGVVMRHRFTVSQTTQDRWQRNENVADAFGLARGDLIAGKHVLVVDDIVTTGATVCACAKELERVADVTVSVAAIGFADSRG